jgi:hypothetical protein
MVCIPEVENQFINAAADSFDVASAIEGLLNDPARASIHLPRTLTAEQRKHAKKIIEQHQNLKCESFGLGDDRQMHIFKCNSSGVPGKTYMNQIHGESIAECSPQSFSVKNTFIDDWIQPDGVPADGRNVQSMPHNMFAQRLSAELIGHTTSNVDSKDRIILPVTHEVTSQISIESTASEFQIAVGSSVVIDGLIKAPMFNGAAGTVQSWDADTGRYDILLSVPTPGGQRWAKVKGDNLRLSLPKQPISFGCFDE